MLGASTFMSRGMTRGECQMPWRDFDARPFLRGLGLEAERTTPLRTNETCFMRRQHRCGKVFGASKSCFVACPTDESLEPLLALVEAKLAAHGIEAVVAIRERAYGQEIVCTKICGRIIESRFCLVVLDEVKRDGVSLANPNVYYEYGLMTALRKHVIPFQRDGMALAFNIQNQDTVKYNDRNMAEEIERAIRDAIAQTERGQQPEDADLPVSARGVRRRLELAGYVQVPSETNVLANVATEDTQFMTLVSKSDGYLFLAKVDNDRDVGNYLDDLPVLVYRLEELRRRTEVELRDLRASVEARRGSDKLHMKAIFDTQSFLEQRELDLENKRAPILETRLRSLEAAHLGFISAPEVDASLLKVQTEAALADIPITPVWNEGTSLRIGDATVELGRSLPESAAARDL